MPTLIHKKQIIGQAVDSTALVNDTVGWVCANRLKLNLISQELFGVTITVNDDKSISLSGTPNTTFDLPLSDPAILMTAYDSYTLRGCPNNGSWGSYCLYLATPNVPVGSWKDFGNGHTETGDNNYYSAYIRLNVGVSVTGLTFYPMLCREKYKDIPYSPYHTSVEEELESIGSGIYGQYVTETLYANNWEDNIYSFESLYPSAMYDIEIEPNGDVLTDAQYKSWSGANILGMLSGNTCKAFGKVPIEDIPIILKYVRKV